jgi:hypothetical protein
VRRWVALCGAFLLTLVLASSFVPIDAQAGFCGMKPIKPVTPVGCRDLVAVCICDRYGHNCRWEWHCIVSRSEKHTHGGGDGS